MRQIRAGLELTWICADPQLQWRSDEAKMNFINYIFSVHFVGRVGITSSILASQFTS